MSTTERDDASDLDRATRTIDRLTKQSERISAELDEALREREEFRQATALLEKRIARLQEERVLELAGARAEIADARRGEEALREALQEATAQCCRNLCAPERGYHTFACRQRTRLLAGEIGADS